MQKTHTHARVSHFVSRRKYKSTQRLKPLQSAKHLSTMSVPSGDTLERKVDRGAESAAPWGLLHPVQQIQKHKKNTMKTQGLTQKTSATLLAFFQTYLLPKVVKKDVGRCGLYTTSVRWWAFSIKSQRRELHSSLCSASTKGKKVNEFWVRQKEEVGVCQEKRK